MKLKKGVKLNGVKSEILIAIMVVDSIYMNSDSELILTSVCDGKHSIGSLHYPGLAFDCRTRHLSKVEKDLIFKEIKDSLSEEFDVVLHSTHIHIEFQPK